jgi:hypothetical protein
LADTEKFAAGSKLVAMKPLCLARDIQLKHWVG